jgi:PAS domain S-box-containing protein
MVGIAGFDKLGCTNPGWDMSDEHWRRFIAFAPVAIAMLDRDFRYIATSRRWLTDFVFSDDSILGRSHYEVFPEIPENWRAVHRRCLAGATEHHDGELYRRSDGTQQWIRWAVQPWFNETSDVGGIVIFAEDVTARRRTEDDLRQSRDALEAQAAELQRRSDQLRRLASALTVAEQHAREQLARTLHDGLQQLLFGASLRLQRLAAGGCDGPAAGEVLRQANDDVTQAIAASRSLAVELFPPALHAAGLPSALAWLAMWTEQKYGLHVDLSADPAADPVEKDIRALVFESVRELLFNIVKHAKTNRAAIDVALTGDDVVRVTVIDHGVGFDPESIFAGPAANNGLGLFSVRERLALFGGQLHADSTPGGTTHVVVSVPRHGG